MNDTEQCKIGESRRRVDIYFHSNGKIDISSRVAWALSLHNGDVIGVMSIRKEYYLYVSRRYDDIKCEMARYRHAVRQRHSRCNTFYCNAVSITRSINTITGSRESWLFVGNSKEIQVDGRSVVALPLIVGNNQYKQ